MIIYCWSEFQNRDLVLIQSNLKKTVEQTYLYFSKKVIKYNDV